MVVSQILVADTEKTINLSGQLATEPTIDPRTSGVRRCRNANYSVEKFSMRYVNNIIACICVIRQTGHDRLLGNVKAGQ
jgi:hypothetical protein